MKKIALTVLARLFLDQPDYINLPTTKTSGTWSSTTTMDNSHSIYVSMSLGMSSGRLESIFISRFLYRLAIVQGGSTVFDRSYAETSGKIYYYI